MTAAFLDDYLPYLLQRTDRLLSRRFQDTLRARGVQPSQWRVLAVLREHGPLSIRDLAGSALMPQPTTTHAVDRLTQQRCVRRQPSPDDGRLTIVDLTGEGRRLAEALVRAAELDLRHTLEAAGLTTSAAFLAELRALVDRLDVAGGA